MNTSHPHLSHPKYRRDIDGLRAVAVLSVVVFHAFPVVMQGGFIGVDVFFVISGYLISTIIFENLDKQTFSFSEFYARRIKRIFPALLLVLIASYVFGWYALFELEYKQLGKHIAAGAGFISNFVLWSESGYFNTAAETKPLLHLWSLGIEEQFYIVWPFMLWLAWKSKVNLITLTSVVAVVSFSLNVVEVKNDVVASFYSPLTRFWELLSGSILAWFGLNRNSSIETTTSKINNWLTSVVYGDKGSVNAPILSNVLSLLGLLLLAYGLLRFNKHLSFPGAWAVVPVLGTALIILAGPNAWFNQNVLSRRLTVWFGLISYPLYLWHWPLLSFARIVESELPNHEIRIGAVLLSIFLAWLTYKFVERPVRFGAYSNTTIALLLCTMFVTGVIGYFTHQQSGIKGRIPNANLSQHDSKVVQSRLDAAERNCEIYFPDWQILNDNPCRFQKKEGNTIAVIGDSHAAPLYLGLSELIGSDGGVAAFSASCAAPFIDISTATNDPRFRNERVNAYKLINAAYSYVIANPNIETVLLAHDPTCSYTDAKDMANLSSENANANMIEGMKRSFALLSESKKKVIVLFDNPYLPFQPEMCVNRPFRISSNREKCFFPRTEFDALAPYANYKELVMSVLKDYPSIRTHDVSESLCDSKNCYLKKNGVVLYRDRNHLNTNGSRFVAPYIVAAINSHD